MSGPPPPPPSKEEEKIRILIVDDIPETRENLKKLLFFESDIEVVGAATNGLEGIKMAQELKPDVILMDINMPGMDGIAASEQITRQLPYVQIIIMSVQGESDYLRRSMLAGAREFLIKPFSGDELIVSVKRVYQLAAQQKARMPYAGQVAGSAPPTVATTASASAENGKIISIFSPKGGVGCSTLAINIGIAMHKHASAKVAVIDASLQFGDISVLLNLHPRATIADLSQHADELEVELIESVLANHNSGIKALLAPAKPEEADLVTPDAIVRILTKMRRMFDIIIVDMYSSLQDVVLSVLDESDRIVVVTTPEIPSIKSARLFFEVTDALEYPRAKIQLILNKTDKRVGIRAQDIESSIKFKVEGQFPLDEKTVISAVNQGIPYVISSPATDLSKATITYAQELYQNITEVVEVD